VSLSLFVGARVVLGWNIPYDSSEMYRKAFRGEWVDDYRTFWNENSAAMTLELLFA